MSFEYPTLRVGSEESRAVLIEAKENLRHEFQEIPDAYIGDQVMGIAEGISIRATSDGAPFFLPTDQDAVKAEAEIWVPPSNKTIDRVAKLSITHIYHSAEDGSSKTKKEDKRLFKLFAASGFTLNYMFAVTGTSQEIKVDNLQNGEETETKTKESKQCFVYTIDQMKEFLASSIAAISLKTTNQ